MSITTLAIVSLLPAVLAVTGNATTYYGGGQGGACSFGDYTLPDGVYAASISDRRWENSQACGGCIAVTGENAQTVTAMIVNECNQCGQNNIALENAGYSQLTIADSTTNTMTANWDYVNCPIRTPLYVESSSGSNQYYFAAQVLNATQRTRAVSASSDGGASWVALKRESYNYFVAPSGSGRDQGILKLTSVNGRTVVVPGVSAGAAGSTFAQNNY